MTKITMELVKKIIDMIERGHSAASVKRELGIGQSSLKRWSELGNEMLKKYGGEPMETMARIDASPSMTDNDKRFAKSCVAYAARTPEAYGKYVGKLEEIVHIEAMSDGKFALEVLSRREPKTWAKQTIVQGEIEQRHTITQIVIHGSEEVKQLSEPEAIEAEFREL